MRNELQIPSGEQLQQCWGAHAEQNAVAQAARHGISLEGATAYVTIQPCSMCAKSLINAGVKEIHYAGAYPDQLTQSLLTHANVNVVRKDAQ
jgi:dCMP deaminase